MISPVLEAKVLLTKSEICKHCGNWGLHGEYHGKKWNKCKYNLEDAKIGNICINFRHKGGK
jgi:hypothetical protein